jgi:hypothetical protein
MPSLAIDPAAFPSALANRVLEREAWARTQLAVHAGRVFVVAIGPAATAMRIDPTGMVASIPLAGGTRTFGWRHCSAPAFCRSDAKDE